MIRYGLKLWSNNIDLFEEARVAWIEKKFDFIEIYANSDREFDWDELAKRREVPMNVHATHSGNFHEFVLGEKELTVWRRIIALADFFGAQHIVVHPGRGHTISSFQENLRLIDDPRILIENMAGLSLEQYSKFAVNLEDLKAIREIKPMCLDFEKAVKAARYLGVPYREYIVEAIDIMQPTYCHVSGGDPKSPNDEHQDLESSDIDFAWIKERLLAMPHDIDLVFETPKKIGIENDLKNMAYFKSL